MILYMKCMFNDQKKKTTMVDITTAVITSALKQKLKKYNDRLTATSSKPEK